LGLIGLLFLVFIGLNLGVGLFGFLLIVLAGLWTYGVAPKCPSCHWPWTLKQVSTRVVAQQRGYGLVTRVETHSGRVGDQATSSVVRRQERVPTVTATVQIDYVCAHCKKQSFKQYTRTSEDFTPPAPVRAAPVVVNVNQAAAPPPQTFLHCRHCGTLNQSQRVAGAMRCASCGAAL
jgi:ribosomal protein L37AE/L43A